MLLISSEINSTPTFRLIPISIDCPYNEVVYDPTNKVLAIISKEKKNTLKMAAKLNEFGDPDAVKKPSDRPLGKPPYKEQRIVIETYHEYHITNKQEISDFVLTCASNVGIFDYSKFIV